MFPRAQTIGLGVALALAWGATAAAQTVSVEAAPSTGQEPLAVTFTLQGSSPACVGNSFLRLDFGDNTPPFETAPGAAEGAPAVVLHTYVQADTYTATVSVFCPGPDFQISETRTVVVTGNPLLCQAFIDGATPPAPVVNELVTLSAVAVSGCDAADLAWTFIDKPGPPGAPFESTARLQPQQSFVTDTGRVIGVALGTLVFFTPDLPGDYTVGLFNAADASATVIDRITVTVSAVFGSDLALTQLSAGPSPVGVGAEVHYAVAVENQGPDEVAAVLTVLRLPAQVQVVSATSDVAACTTTRGLVTCQAPLAGGAGYAFAVTAIARGVNATARASARVSALGNVDPNPGNDVKDAFTNIVVGPDLSVSVSHNGSASRVEVETPVQFTVTVRNDGPAGTNAYGALRFTEDMRVDPNSLSATGSTRCFHSAIFVSCSRFLSSGDSFSFNVNLHTPVNGPHRLIAQATVPPYSVDPNLSNNVGFATVEFWNRADLLFEWWRVFNFNVINITRRVADGATHVTGNPKFTNDGPHSTHVIGLIRTFNLFVRSLTFDSVAGTCPRFPLRCQTTEPLGSGDSSGFSFEGSSVAPLNCFIKINLELRIASPYTLDPKVNEHNDLNLKMPNNNCPLLEPLGAPVAGLDAASNQPPLALANTPTLSYHANGIAPQPPRTEGHGPAPGWAPPPEPRRRPTPMPAVEGRSA